jgi:hypothetical protein
MQCIGFDGNKPLLFVRFFLSSVFPVSIENKKIIYFNCLIDFWVSSATALDAVFKRRMAAEKLVQDGWVSPSAGGRCCASVPLARPWPPALTHWLRGVAAKPVPYAAISICVVEVPRVQSIRPA